MYEYKGQIFKYKKHPLRFIPKACKRIFRIWGYDVVSLNPPISQSQSKVSDQLEYYETPIGNYYVPKDAVNDGIRYAMIHGEVFDAPVYEEGRKHIKEDTIVLDIGSNFGQMALMFSKHVGNNGLVYAFDVQPFVFDILKKNIKANNAKVQPIFGAVHEKAGEILKLRKIDFEHAEQTWGSYGVDYSKSKDKSIEVKTITIDEMNIDKPVSFIKTDIQGGDLFALKGAVKTINKNRMPIIFEYESSLEERYHMCFQDYVDFVNDIDYYFAKVVMPNNFLILPKENRKSV